MNKIFMSVLIIGMSLLSACKVPSESPTSEKVTKSSEGTSAVNSSSSVVTGSSTVSYTSENLGLESSSNYPVPTPIATPMPVPTPIAEVTPTPIPEQIISDESALTDVVHYWITPENRFPEAYLTTTGEHPEPAILNGTIFRIFNSDQVTEHSVIGLNRLTDPNTGENIFTTEESYFTFEKVDTIGYMSIFQTATMSQPLYICVGANHVGIRPLTIDVATCVYSWGGLINPTPIGFVAPIK